MLLSFPAQTNDIKQSLRKLYNLLMDSILRKLIIQKLCTFTKFAIHLCWGGGGGEITKERNYIVNLQNWPEYRIDPQADRVSLTARWITLPFLLVVL